MSKVTVLNLDALSYSGTTWLNLLLGSHPDVFALGPPHRVWSLKDEKFEGACLIHGKACEFWSGFGENWDKKENFFLALARHSGKKIFLIDNAHQEFIDVTMKHQDVEVLQGRYIRDARAITASYVRKMSDKGISYIDSIQPTGWFYASFMSIPSLNELQNAGQFVTHYEDAVKDQTKFLKTAGDYLGIDYDESAYRFWEADHHITSGNQGPIAMIKLYQGENVGDFESKSVYQEQLDRLIKNPTKAFSDERWKKQLTNDDLQEFDRLLGKKNSALGYQRSHSDLATRNHIYNIRKHSSLNHILVALKNTRAAQNIKSILKKVK